jgi:hypothetical protein
LLFLLPQFVVSVFEYWHETWVARVVELSEALRVRTCLAAGNCDRLVGDLRLRWGWRRGASAGGMPGQGVPECLV